MNELISIQERDGKKAVSARELHAFLESKQDFSNWIKNRISKYGLVENQDFVRFDKVIETTGGRSIEYALTIDAAKELSMVEGNAKGKQARQYFIEMEKKVVQLQKSLEPEELLLQSVQLMIEQKKKFAVIESRLKAIEEKPEVNGSIQNFSILGYCRNINKQINIDQAKAFAAKCKSLCKNAGLEVGTIPDPRFGRVNTYPVDILKQVIG